MLTKSEFNASLQMIAALTLQTLLRMSLTKRRIPTDEKVQTSRQQSMRNELPKLLCTTLRQKLSSNYLTKQIKAILIMKIISKSQTSDQQSRKLWSTLYTQKRWNLSFWRRMSLHKFILSPLKLHLRIYLFQTLKQRLKERKLKPIKESHIGKKLRPKKRIDAKWWEESSRKFMRKQRKEKRSKEVSRDKESSSKMLGCQE